MAKKQKKTCVSKPKNAFCAKRLMVDGTCMDKRQEILKASQSLFSKFGLKKVTTDDIAKEAGISKATIYRYYRNKSQIFDEVVNVEAEQLLKAIRQAVDKETAVAGKFRAHLLSKLSKVKKLINFYHVTEDPIDGFWPHIAEVRRRFLDQEKAIIEEILVFGVQSGELMVKDVDRISRMMIVSQKSQELEWAVNQHDGSLTDYVDTMIGVMLNGIRKRLPLPDNNSDRMMNHNNHTFHIPVMGTGFTIDTPLRVAKYGISSVMSIGDDILIEKMRKFHSEKNGLPYTEIPMSDRDHRPLRITAYLNLIGKLVDQQVKELQRAPFESNTDITRYFEMLPDSPLKEKYLEMMAASDHAVKARMQDDLRKRAVPGNLDVNIMTKIDGDMYHEKEKLPPEYAVARSALRGFAESDLSSSIVLSAGMNRNLFGYMAQFSDFFPNESGFIKKKITLKVSDYRSAAIQGKLLAKEGLWVSEYRVESGLNCGGHAFASKGYLMGPILEEFRQKKEALVENLRTSCNKALRSKDRVEIDSSKNVRITVQGGIGTAGEDKYLRKYYEVDGTGWGTPFLLVPEVVNVDKEHLKKLMVATEKDVYLSQSSPLGVPFWNLRTTASEETRRRRLQEGKPGSPCPQGFLASDTEFTEIPICRASRNYQKRKLQQLSESGLPDKDQIRLKELITAKSCICFDLAGGALVKNDIDPNRHPAICTGPGIVNYSQIATLEEMVSHIYGRLSLLNSEDRPNLFIRELRLYVDHLRQELEEQSKGLINRTAKYFAEFRLNLQNGIEHYRLQADRFSREQRERFIRELESIAGELEKILPSIDPVIPIEGTI